MRTQNPLPTRHPHTRILCLPEETGSFITVFVSCFGTMVSGQTGQVSYTIVVE